MIRAVLPSVLLRRMVPSLAVGALLLASAVLAAGEPATGLPSPEAAPRQIEVTFKVADVVLAALLQLPALEQCTLPGGVTCYRGSTDATIGALVQQGRATVPMESRLVTQEGVQSSTGSGGTVTIADAQGVPPFFPDYIPGDAAHLMDVTAYAAQNGAVDLVLTLRTTYGRSRTEPAPVRPGAATLSHGAGANDGYALTYRLDLPRCSVGPDQELLVRGWPYLGEGEPDEARETVLVVRAKLLAPEPEGK